LEILPFIQCHHTRGFADGGGERNACNMGSEERGGSFSVA
jgi:hypothetical protein